MSCHALTAQCTGCFKSLNSGRIHYLSLVQQMFKLDDMNLHAHTHESFGLLDIGMQVYIMQFEHVALKVNSEL